ncbi:MAG: proline dehydrogenase family protein, partial [Bacteroidota bacterium]
MEAIHSLNLAFDDLETAFAHRSDFELKKMYFIFSTINQPVINSVGTRVASLALNLHLPFSEVVIKNTVFEHFCGGTSIENCENTIQKLAKYRVGSILDYSVEGKGTEKSFEQTAAEILRSIDYSAGREEIPFAVFKVTGIAPFSVLEKLHAGYKLTEKEEAAWERAKVRFQKITERASQKDVRLLVDAEETWIQNPIDELVYEAMRKYNTEKAIIYNTFQHYTIAATERLLEAHALSQKEGFYLGAKLVRGAYMEK